MSSVFADTWYWVARFSQRDAWHAAAIQAETLIGDASIITTYDVLTEFLTSFAGSEPRVRVSAARTVLKIVTDETIRVLPQSRESFLRGVERYENRPDKGYSLVDCISMNAMDKEGIREILTNDRHFAQESYTLIP